MKNKIDTFIKVFFNIITKLFILAIIVLFLYNIAKSIWKNYQTVQKIESIKEQIAKEEEANLNLKNLIIYYQTDTFKELEARRKLGYKKPGENVIMMPDLATPNSTSDIINQDSKNKSETKEEPNFIKWYYYIFK